MRVDLGAGATRTEGWVSVDLNAGLAGVVADIRGPLPFADGEVDELRAVDCLEHISYRETDAALAEWARVCAPGAPVYVQVPDAPTIMRWFCNDENRLMLNDRGVCSPLEGAEWRLLGGHADGRYATDFRLNAHYSLWSHATLTAALVRAGFVVDRIDRNGHPNLLAFAHRK